MSTPTDTSSKSSNVPNSRLPYSAKGSRIPPAKIRSNFVRSKLRHPFLRSYIGKKNPYTDFKIQSESDYDEYLREYCYYEHCNSAIIEAEQVVAQMQSEMNTLRSTVVDATPQMNECPFSQFISSNVPPLCPFLSSKKKPEQQKEQPPTPSEPSKPPSESYQKAPPPQSKSRHRIVPFFFLLLLFILLCVLPSALCYRHGYTVGEEAGYSAGKEDGYKDGQRDGYRNGYADNFRNRSSSPATSTATGTPRDTAISDGYIGNKKTKKYHLSTCSYLPDKWNQVSFDSSAEAESQGYKPCSHCNP